MSAKRTLVWVCVCVRQNGHKDRVRGHDASLCHQIHTQLKGHSCTLGDIHNMLRDYRHCCLCDARMGRWSGQWKCGTLGSVADVSARWDIWQLQATLGDHTHRADILVSIGNILYGCGGGIGLADNLLFGILDLHEINESISHMRLDANHISALHDRRLCRLPVRLELRWFS